MPEYVISTFYKFHPFNDYEDFKKPLLKLMQQHNILGTILLANEGINGTFAASEESSKILYDFLRSDIRFKDLSFHRTLHNTCPFEKAKVKTRKEIVTLGVRVEPFKSTGEHIPPDEWNQLIKESDVMVIDTRNDYEVELGTFRNAINPNTENFRDFPDYVEKHLVNKKDKKIAMFCTGGIRCEKSTAYLKKLGFKNVYQLKGGILNYFEQIPKEKSLWQGKCFVFDDRETIEPYTS